MKRFSYRDRDYAFGQTMLGLRAALELTQATLAEQLGVSRRAIGRWEGGSDYPKVKHLKQLIVLAVTHQVWPAESAAEKIRELWHTARQKAPLDETWLAALLREAPASLAAVPHPTGAPEMQQRTPFLPPSNVQQAGAPERVRVDWGDALAVPAFYGRAEEVATLRQWLVEERCRVVSVLGIGGIGKSALVITAIHQVAAHFAVVIFRSLRDAPSCAALLDDCLQVLDPHAVDAALPSLEVRISRLLEHLREQRVLLVLDNVETLLAAGDLLGHLRGELEEYSLLLQRVGESAHTSCLLLTSREQLTVLRALEGSQGPVRALRLAGLNATAGAQLLTAHDLVGSVAEQTRLVEAYGGNPLALQIVAQTIVELFGGAIGPFLAQGTVVFGSIAEQIGEQVARLSAFEQTILYWLAIGREPVTLAELHSLLAPPPPPRLLLEAMDSLRRRCLVERGPRPGSFTLQAVVLEYLTDRLVEQVADEINTGVPDLLAMLSLVQATAKDYVRQSQERLIGRPILQQLGRKLGDSGREQLLLKVLEIWRNRPALEQGYGPGNVVNLLRLLRGDLRGLDLSCLAIRQAYLAAVEAQDANLANAHLTETVFAEAFNHPTAIALSADGAYLVSGTYMGEVSRWRVVDRALVWSVQGHTRMIHGMALSADGEVLASGSFDQTVKLWRMVDGQLLATLQGHTGGVMGVALSRDGQLVASASQDGTIRLWEASSRRALLTLPVHPAGAWGVAFSHDGQVLISGSADGTLMLWDVTSGQLLATLPDHKGGVWGLALNKQGTLLASGSFDGTIKLWELPGGRLLATLHEHTSAVRGVALSSDGQLLASGSLDGTVKLWQTASGRLLATLRAHTGGVLDVALSEDGSLLASGSEDGTLKLWQTASGHLQATLQGFTDVVYGVAVSADQQLVASGSQDGTVKVWEPGSGQLLALLHGHTGAVWSVALSNDGRLLASGGYDGTVRLWELPSGRPLETMPAHKGAVRCVALSGDGRLLASAGEDGVVRLWQAPKGRLLAALYGHSGLVHSVALNQDGRLVASAGEDGTVRLWETPDGRLLTTYSGHSGAVWDVVLDWAGSYVASASIDGTVRLWETQTGRLLPTLHGHTAGVSCIALSKDGALLVNGSNDGMLWLWEIPSGRRLATLQGHVGPVKGVALSADGLVVSSGEDGTVRLWEAHSGVHLRTLRSDRRYERLDITGIQGLTEAQKASLLTLGAFDATTPVFTSA